MGSTGQTRLIPCWLFSPETRYYFCQCLLCLCAGKSSIFLFLQGIPACCVYSLAGSQHRLTSLHASATEVGITTHSPSHTQLPSKWDWLLLKPSTAIKTVNMEACECVCCFSLKHGDLPFLPMHLMSSSGKILVLPRGQSFCLHRGIPFTCCARQSPIRVMSAFS